MVIRFNRDINTLNTKSRCYTLFYIDNNFHYLCLALWIPKNIAWGYLQWFGGLYNILIPLHVYLSFLCLRPRTSQHFLTYPLGKIWKPENVAGNSGWQSYFIDCSQWFFMDDKELCNQKYHSTSKSWTDKLTLNFFI